MKKYFAYIAFAALVFAVSCNKEINTTVETELITVEINPEVKTSLSGVNTEWTAGDAVSVTVAGKNIGTLTLVDGNTFSGEIEAGHNGDATLNYPAGVTEVPATQAAVANSFANGAALLEGTTTMDALRAGEGATLSNKTALLQFSVAQAGDVTFEVGATKYTVTGCQTSKTYYACIAPASNVNFVARIGGYLSKAASSNKTFEANEISNLNSLPAPVDSGWRLRGAFDWTNGKVFYKDTQYYVVKNITFSSVTEIKVFGNNSWLRAAANVCLPNTWYKIAGYDGQNTRIMAGTYDIYLDATNKYVCYVSAGEKLNISIPTTTTATVYLNSTNYQSLWCWNKDKNTENFTGGNWPGISSTTNVTINGKTYRKWELKSCNLGVYLNMIFSKNGSEQTGEDGSTGLLMGETMFIKLENNKARFNNAI